MSQLKTTSLSHKDNNTGTPNITMYPDGTTQLPGTVMGGFRNQIINGDFRVWQRGTTFTFSTGPVFTADHWRTYGTGSNVAVRSQDVPADEGFTFSLLSNLPTQPIELQDAGFASQFNAGSTWTLSCWAKTTTPPKAIMAFADTSTGLNQGTSFSGGEKTMTAIKTKGGWVKYSATFPCDQSPTSESRCLRAYCDTKGGMVLWTGFQLEPGPVATPFEQRPIGTELALCQRYYQTYEDILLAVVGGNSFAFKEHRSPRTVTMRTNPTEGYGSLENIGSVNFGSRISSIVISTTTGSSNNGSTVKGYYGDAEL